jgi:FlaA1/EpsC-like NDP-sugar epimerase
VLISTDKAVHPTSVMGASKRICEQILMTRAPRHAAFCAVRFGNVVGSRGSVVPTFMKQIEAGGPVTLTDARMTRYFMSIQEAVHLVLHAATLATSSASGGNIFMLDMGEPVRILDLAERMIRLSGRIPGQDIEVRIVGVRPGEKLQEELSTLEESSSPTAHPSITRLDTVAADADVLEQGVLMLEHHVDELNDARCAQVLHRLAIDHSTTGT